jgi:hypothetical protein
MDIWTKHHKLSQTLSVNLEKLRVPTLYETVVLYKH